MEKTISVFLVSLAAMGAHGLGLLGVDQSTPVKTVESYMAAIADEDVKALARLVALDAADENGKRLLAKMVSNARLEMLRNGEAFVSAELVNVERAKAEVRVGVMDERNMMKFSQMNLYCRQGADSSRAEWQGGVSPRRRRLRWFSALPRKVTRWAMNLC